MDDRDMLDGLKHLAYEYNMLERTAETLLAMDWSTPSLTDDAKFQRNVLVESFAVHARILYEFLWKAERTKDFTAKAYLPDWAEARPDVLVLNYTVTDVKGKPVEPNVFEVASQRIVHLSRARKQYEAKDEGWPVKTIWKTIAAGMQRFYHQLSTTGLSARSVELARESTGGTTTATGTSHFAAPNTFAVNRFIRSWDDVG